MSKVDVTRSDVVWNYIGTIVTMASGFVLLPLLMKFLTPEELGLWYVFMAVSNLAMLFEFGFNPTFSRNIVYVVSGARRLTKFGCDFDSVAEGVDWHLLKSVIWTSKCIYAAVAVLVALLLATAGTVYVDAITRGMPGAEHWISWVIFCLASLLNLYFLHSMTLLRGFGDIAGENKSKTLGRVLQLAISAALLCSGLGLVGASVGYLANSVSMRIMSGIQIRRHAEIISGLKSDRIPPTVTEVGEILKTVSHLAWRDGFVQCAGYASTQAMSLVGSVTLGLAETGTYSILMQFGNAIYNFASAYPKAYFPAFQAAYASHDTDSQRAIVSRGVVAYWLLFVFGFAGVSIVIMPLLPFIKDGFYPDPMLFSVLCAYLGLWNQHSIFCNYIIGMNEVPYMKGYIVAAVLGVPLSFILSGVLGWGAWGVVFGQAVSQLLYNNWHWPMYLSRRLETTYLILLRQGCGYWKSFAAEKLH